MKDQHDSISAIIKGFELQDEPKKTVLVVYHKTPNYVIYEVKETGEISYKTSSEFVDNTFEIALKLDKVEAFLNENTSLWYQYKNTMAEIYINYLSNDDKRKNAAKKLLNSVTWEITYNKYNKVYYLFPCIILLMVVCAVAISMKTYNVIAATHLPLVDTQILSLVYMMTFGAIGGLLSIALFIDKHDDKFSRCMTQRVYAGLFRMLVSMLSGLIIYILYSSDLLYVFSKSQNRYFEYGLAILGGFSQNLVPNLASKASETVRGKTPVADTDVKQTQLAVK